MDNSLKVYKSAKDYIIELLIDKSDKNNLGRRVYDSNYAKYRTEKAFVTRIYNKWDNQNEISEIRSDFDSKFIYRRGQFISELHYNNNDDDEVYVEGIHFYLTEEAAYYHNFHYFLGNGIYTGEYKSYFDDGKLKCKCQYYAGKIDGLYLEYNNSGTLVSRYHIKDGLFEFWHNNGNPKEKYTIVNSQKQGSYEKWYENGDLETKCFYDENGNFDGIYQYWYKDPKHFMICHYKNGKLIPS